MSGSSFFNAADSQPVAVNRRIMVCLGMGLFAALTLIGLRFAPTPTNTQSLTYIPPQVPEVRLRFVWLDARQTCLTDSPLVAQLQILAPDYLLADNLASGDLIALAKALHMEQRPSPQLFQPTLAPAGDRSAFGVCILSKYPLFDAQPLTRAGAVFGVSAFSVVQNRKFMLASVHKSNGADQNAEADQLIAYWRMKESPPFVRAGSLNWGMENAGLVQPTTGWFDGLTPFEHIAPAQPGAVAPPRARIMFTQGWSCLAGGYDAAPGGQTIAWVDATSAHVVATTTTAPSDLDD